MSFGDTAYSLALQDIGIQNKMIKGYSTKVLQQYRDTKIQGYKDKRIQDARRIKVYWGLGYGSTEIQLGYRDKEIQ